MAIKDRKNKKAIFYTIDAMLAGFLIIGALLILSKYPLLEDKPEQKIFISQDILNSLSELKIYEVNNSFSWVQEDINNGTIVNSSISVLDQISQYWATNNLAPNNISKARLLLEWVINNTLPDKQGLRISLDTTDLLFRNVSTDNNLIGSSRMISGIAQNKSSLTGSSGSAYLRRVHDKTTSSYAYFGGFVGQGNITVELEEIPSDVGIGDVTHILVELDAIAPFELMINGDPCANITPSATMMLPKRWDVSNCNASIKPGINNITLYFYGNLNDAYILGGNIRVDYKTDEFSQTISYTSNVYRFPDIRGIVNLYDGFYVPGNLTNMSIYLHYLANHSVTGVNTTFYLKIGNTTVYNDSYSTTVQSILLNDSDIQAKITNYSALNGNTIPIRMGFDNLTYESIPQGNSEVMIATDVSGSMDFMMNWANDGWGDPWYNSNCPGNSACGAARNCNDNNIYNSDTSRLSIAKCLDIQFSQNVTNITGNKIGLVSYDSSTHNSETVSPTTNLNLIAQTIGTASPETGYAANGGTCICCGINSARDQLKAGVNRLVLIANKTSWKYNTNSFIGPPANDINNYSWYSFEYNDASWLSNNAVLGHDAGGGGVAVNTELGAAPLKSSYVNLWKRFNDSQSTSAADFSSGILNYTANTYGWTNGSVGDDGWDWKTGAYTGNSTNVNISGLLYALAGDYKLRIFINGSSVNGSKNNISDGSYGIQINITDEMYQILQNGGNATLSFTWNWTACTKCINLTDWMWIKARLTNTSNKTFYLGTNLDANNDSTVDVYATNRTTINRSGTAFIDITKNITKSGIYYLDIGGKFSRNMTNKNGTFYFDNVLINITNKTIPTSHYYFRKHFTVSDLNLVKRGLLNILSDDNVTIYLNGNLIFEGNQTLNGTYWDRRGVYVDKKNFRLGDNVVAVDLTNNNGSAKFDLELLGFNKTQQGAILVMTDGQANVECPSGHICPTDLSDSDYYKCRERAKNDSIDAACDARQTWGIQVFAVGYSVSADESTLQGIAQCGEGIYAKSSNPSALNDFYNTVTNSIISASIVSQSIVITGGNVSASNLYGDSYISYNYTPVSKTSQLNEISVEMQSQQFGNCTAQIDIPDGVTIIDAKVTSYSGVHWTRYLKINSNTIYNLTSYDSNYIQLGDPYLIQASGLVNGTNQIYIDTGDDTQNSTGCSPNNTLIYTMLIPSAILRTDVLPYKIGCNWTVESQSLINSSILVPSSYNRLKKCYYTNSTINCDGSNCEDSQDAYDYAVYHIFKQLDSGNNGRILVSLTSDDLEVLVLTVSNLPYMWGPSIMQAEVWQ